MVAFVLGGYSYAVICAVRVQHRTPRTAHRAPQPAHRNPHTAHRTPQPAHQWSDVHAVQVWLGVGRPCVAVTWKLGRGEGKHCKLAYRVLGVKQ